MEIRGKEAERKCKKKKRKPKEKSMRKEGKKITHD
jgi:hypothetical protein